MAYYSNIGEDGEIISRNIQQNTSLSTEVLSTRIQNNVSYRVIHYILQNQENQDFEWVEILKETCTSDVLKKLCGNMYFRIYMETSLNPDLVLQELYYWMSRSNDEECKNLFSLTESGNTRNNHVDEVIVVREMLGFYEIALDKEL